MMKFKSVLLLLFVNLVMLTSCKKEDPVIPNEEEVITNVNYTLTPDGGGIPVVLSFQDLDGDGGMLPTITGGNLTTNTSYKGVLELFNEQATPIENVNPEILAEAEDHQFFFQTSVSGLTVAYDDQDANNNPLGLKTTLTTTDAGSGTITITLRHEPNKSASGVAGGDISNAGGETDIEVSFAIDVQ